MRTFLAVLALGRRRIPGFLLIACLVSLGTAASLVEPWIYRAIVDDVAGVFVEPAPLARIESLVEGVGRSSEHLSGSGKRVFRKPPPPHAARSAAPQAASTHGSPGLRHRDHGGHSPRRHARGVAGAQNVGRQPLGANVQRARA